MATLTAVGHGAFSGQKPNPALNRTTSQGRFGSQTQSHHFMTHQQQSKDRQNRQQIMLSQR